MRSRFAVASPALSSSIIMSIENPCARRSPWCNRNGSRQAIRGPGGGQDWDGDSGVGSASVHSHDERPDPPTEDSGPGLAATPQVAGGRHDRLTNARLAAWFGTHRCERKPGRAGQHLFYDQTALQSSVLQ
jgi:hypothetical protein